MASAVTPDINLRYENLVTRNGALIRALRFVFNGPQCFAQLPEGANGLGNAIMGLGVGDEQYIQK